HRDSLGSEQAVRPGEVNWMTAGRGITHSERFEKLRAQGGPLDGIQAWVALPREHEEDPPGFWHHAGAELPMAAEGAARFRLIAGEALGLKSPVRTYSPLFYVHCELPAGARVPLPVEFPERAAYVVSGSIEAGARRFAEGQMPVFQPHAPAVLTALEPSIVMLLGGEPVGERFIEWNFVSSSKERIAQAKADWRAGRMKLPDLDSAEFIALPSDPAAPPSPMS
ncbi:MAG TPA: pirin-like C-terminal cupin domain-containing protein, partial [Burkholderiales bacterium]